jgi:DNA-binding transcriptional regulator Cro
MDLKDAVKHFGSQNQLAKALGIARQNITRWVNDGIPPLQQYRLEEITQGKLKRNGAAKGKVRASR